jgi:oligopeptide transport system permease protein
MATLATTLVGTLAGVIAGFYGGFVDSLTSRLADVFFAIPLLLGSILVLTAFPNDENTGLFAASTKLMIALALLGWPQIARIMRSSVLQVKQADYVQAARALGASNARIIRQHVLPNAIAPVIVVSTIALGGYIGVEATLSFLGIGLPGSVVSWGAAISTASGLVRAFPHMLLFPGAFLSVTVLAFIMLGDAVRDALDPKLR